MRLKKVAALCCQEGAVRLFDQTDASGEVVCQWLGDGRAAYPIDGMPYMETDNICTMFDIPEKKQEKMTFRHVAATADINWKDDDPVERELQDPALCVRYEGRELLPLRTSDGIVFIQEKYLTPLDNQDYRRLYQRRSRTGGVYIAAKVGMMLQAVIMPVDVLQDDFVDCLGELTEMCRSALLRKKSGIQTEVVPAEQDERQDTLFQEGGDAEGEK